MGKIIAWVVGILLIIGLGWFIFHHMSGAPTQSGAAGENGTTTQTSGTSNQDLSQDMSSIDAQVQAAGTANSSAQSFNDTPIEQGQ